MKKIVYKGWWGTVIEVGKLAIWIGKNITFYWDNKSFYTIKTKDK